MLTSEPAVAVTDLSMTYRVPVRDAGLVAAARSLVHRRFRDVHAVQNLSFEIAPGQIVGFLGRNGAGKTTTMKILAGILHPTSGRVRVLGEVPWRRSSPYLRKIALIRGSQPIGDAPELTVLDSFRYQQVLYDVEEPQFRRNLAELSSLLDLDNILQRQIRALSLGERMRAGLALALLYRPKVLFLDEPTIGLDVSAARMIRTFIAQYSAQTGATVLLTSHSMVDVETLCPRMILVDEGSIAFDGDRDELSSAFVPMKLIRVAITDDEPDLSAYGDVLHHSGNQVLLRVPRHAVPATTARLLSHFAIADLSVEEPSLENVMDQVYQGLRGIEGAA
ncbi:ABC-2 type transport system ATP-binding protein [Kribbella voronezhensis]|uniref:ABC-2 type transport system ATP-binding protein n=1 Tax=Kribbella voronezhensis TaxID=2512212 RepID=A0A4R7SVL1_9ACTN|nr:ATP-binding cassette domain-containing protein [Kribbella voronezhensis]TDU83214.1 ABC-2 type transport system ATP-binding protein [Kribbella voronezhensis]